jgi:hypothetical protein
MDVGDTPHDELINLQKLTVMKLIKHLANLMFLWSIPFILVVFFWLLTGMSFSYTDAVTSSVWVVVYAFYFMMIFIMYMVSVDEEDALALWK